MAAYTSNSRPFCSLSVTAAITYTNGRNTIGITIDNAAAGNEKGPSQPYLGLRIIDRCFHRAWALPYVHRKR